MKKKKLRTPNASGAYLKALRLNLGATREQAAQAIGCTAGTIGRYERNGISGGMTLRKLYAISKYYGASVSELMTIAEQPA